MHVAEVAEEGRDLPVHARSVDGHSGGPVQLAGDHDYRDAGHVSHEHRTGKQVGHEAQAHQPGEQADHADEDGEPGAQCGVARGVVNAERRDRGRREQRGRRLRAHRQLPARAEDCVKRQGRDGRP